MGGARRADYVTTKLAGWSFTFISVQVNVRPADSLYVLTLNMLLPIQMVVKIIRIKYENINKYHDLQRGGQVE